MDKKRQSYLDILGIPVWKLRADFTAATPCPTDPTASVQIPSPITTKGSKPVMDYARPSTATDHVRGDIPPDNEEHAPSITVDAASDLIHPTPHASMTTHDNADHSTYVPPQSMASSPNISEPDWENLRARVSACTACQLHETRTQTVFGVGSQTADWMFIGEAPGADEDRQGEPFVGRAGRLLNAMLEAIDLKREEVYIANILKCRPPNNREPQPAEALACEAFLLRQIQLIGPRILIAVGRIAAQNLLATTTAIGRLRGRRFTFRDTGIPLVVIYHPAYLLRSPLQKRRSWEDLLLARAVYAKATRDRER
uniref:Type-4 uracil-DNA glycosylase n=1 Tax=Candidatus Kentrum sp. TC TaxID=2126339 RepID=A0A450ZNY3_9GAMM|nr:MAG: uracil-DNA glycosylase, family 4 [Candidatus Kentron sp. TC]